MAGNYPDAPSWRMALDRDGTQIVWLNDLNALTTLGNAELRTLTDENPSTNIAFTPTTGWLCLIFPELRDVDAQYLQWTRSQFGPTITRVEVSANTTNGFDGTWTSIGFSGLNQEVTTKPGYRTRIGSTTAFAVRAIRAVFEGGAGQGHNVTFYSWHVYGEIVPGANPNRLELWHPTLDEKIGPAYFDWGDVQRGSSADRTFRVKNLSGTQTASNIRVAMEALTDSAAPSIVGQHTISYSGGAYLPQVNIGSLAPGAVSGQLTLRRITPSNAVLSLWTFRLFAESTEWA